MTALTFNTPRSFGEKASAPLSFRRLMTAWQVARERRALAQLDERTLADLGISDVDAAREAGRPVWDLPANR